MFLSKTLLNSIEKKKLKNKSKILTLKKVSIFNQQINYLKKIKKKNLKYFSNFYNFNYSLTNDLINKLYFSEQHAKLYTPFNILISYVLTINFTSTNTRIYITDTKGNIIKSYSAGIVKLTGKQKTKRHVALINLLRKVLIETKPLQKNPIILHIKNITKNYPLKRIVKLIQNKFLIISIKSFNNKPHNGCRPKKTKRLK